MSERSRAQSFDGVTILTFDGNGGPGGKAIAHGDRIVVFGSGRGAYASIAESFQGRVIGCFASAVAGSHTGRSISFGIEAPEELRQHGLRTLCPKFTLTFEDPQTVRVSAGPSYSRRQKVLAQIPLVGVDFGAPHFSRSEIRGVRIGPILEPSELGPLRKSGGTDPHKLFRRQVGEPGNYGTLVQGRAAAAKVTGWPWDVLYHFKFSGKYEQFVTPAGFREAAVDHWGLPSSERPGNLVWIYDLGGNLIRTSDPNTNSCRATIEHWLKVIDEVVDYIEPKTTAGDIGPWGCSVIFQVNFNMSDDGVSSYHITAWSGYLMALNHFFQRLDEPKELANSIDGLTTNEPKL